MKTPSDIYIYIPAMRKIYLLFFILSISACKKSEIEQIPDNVPPPDQTVLAVKIENYITRSYILTLGREPDSTEFLSAKTLLTAASLDSTSRQIFLESVFSDADFRPHVYEENRFNLLQNVDTAEFGQWVFIFNLFLQDTSYQLLWPYYQYEKVRMQEMQKGYDEYISETIDVIELQRRMYNNYLYDRINMGSANFVGATFQQMINRNPTSAELQSGVSMVDGNNSILFLQTGSSKDDYLDIMLSSDHYYESQVVLMYLKYLGRTPTSIEMSEGSIKYSTTGDFTSVQRDILATDEFIGL